MVSANFVLFENSYYIKGIFSELLISKDLQSFPSLFAGSSGREIRC